LAVYRTCIYPRTTALAQAAFRWLTRKGIVVGSSTTEELVPTMPRDFFMAMSPLQARAGRRQLRKARRRIDHRRRLAEYYDQLLAERGFPVRHNPDHIDPVLVRYPVRVADKERALATASSRFVELGSWFESPLHPQETPLEAYGYRPGQCPEAERACRQVVNLPVHPRANFQTARRSVDFIAEIGPATD
jgi:dTDP-4-amino-4,6-dideoxygalactose transaminase